MCAMKHLPHGKDDVTILRQVIDSIFNEHWWEDNIEDLGTAVEMGGDKKYLEITKQTRLRFMGFKTAIQTFFSGITHLLKDSVQNRRPGGQPYPHDFKQLPKFVEIWTTAAQALATEPNFDRVIRSLYGPKEELPNLDVANPPTMLSRTSQRLLLKVQPEGSRSAKRKAGKSADDEVGEDHESSRPRTRSRTLRVDGPQASEVPAQQASVSKLGPAQTNAVASSSALPGLPEPARRSSRLQDRTTTPDSTEDKPAHAGPTTRSMTRAQRSREM